MIACASAEPQNQTNSSTPRQGAYPQPAQIIVQPKSSTKEPTAEDRIAGYTGWLTVATIVLAIGTLGLFWLSWRQGKQIERQFAAEQRPWIPADVQLFSGWTWTPEGGGQIGLTCTFRNVGRTPATHVDVHAFIHPGVGEFSPSKEQRRLYERHRDSGPAKPGEGLGLTVFPTEDPPATASIQLELKGAKLDEARAWFKANNAPGSGDVPSFSPIIVGTIAYRYVWNGEKHQTGFILQLLPGIHPRDGNIAKERLRLQSWYPGNPITD